MNLRHIKTTVLSILLMCVGKCFAGEISSAYNITVLNFLELEDRVVFIGNAKLEGQTSKVCQDTTFFWYGVYNEEYGLIKEEVFGDSLYNSLEHACFSSVSNKVYLAGKSGGSEYKRYDAVFLYSLSDNGIACLNNLWEDKTVFRLNRMDFFQGCIYFDLSFVSRKKGELQKGLYHCDENVSEAQLYKGTNTGDSIYYGLSGEEYVLVKSDRKNRIREISYSQNKMSFPYINWSYPEKYYLVSDTVLISTATRWGSSGWKYKFFGVPKKGKLLFKGRKLVIQKRRTHNTRAFKNRNIDVDRLNDIQNYFFRIDRVISPQELIDVKVELN